MSASSTDPGTRAAGALSPAPGAAPAWRAALRQATLEARLLVRNGEQLLLALVIPVGLLIAAAYLTYLDGDRAERLAFAVPGTLALAVLSTAFTSLAIATGFERRYGVLRLLGATPLGRGGLLLGKTGGVLIVEAVQVVVIVGVGLLLGWEPQGDPLSVLVLLLVGTLAFTALALLVAGVLRAEATLALANLVFLVLLLTSGIAFPLDDVPAGVRTALELLPSTALADGLRAVLADGDALPAQPLAVLAVWAAGASAAAARFFRWS
jgi:ABC-2 type transport system permease protein